jgi:hypothetical protein
VEDLKALESLSNIFSTLCYHTENLAIDHVVVKFKERKFWQKKGSGERLFKFCESRGYIHMIWLYVG